jgi:hypothetical protein
MPPVTADILAISKMQVVLRQPEEKYRGNKFIKNFHLTTLL